MIIAGFHLAIAITMVIMGAICNVSFLSSGTYYVGALAIASLIAASATLGMAVTAILLAMWCLREYAKCRREGNPGYERRCAPIYWNVFAWLWVALIIAIAMAGACAAMATLALLPGQSTDMYVIGLFISIALMALGAAMVEWNKLLKCS